MGSKYLEAAYDLAVADSSRSVLDYLRHVVIDARPEPRPFGLLAEPWQWSIAKTISKALEYAIGFSKEKPRVMDFWFTLPRGHDKTSLQGRFLNHALRFAKRKIRAISAAADGDQAGLIRDSMEAEAGLNPWLAEGLHHGKKEVSGPRGKLDILTSDAGSSYGLLSDLVIIDEITHWKSRDLWDVIWSGREKRENCVVVVITNAGVLESWQDDIRQEAIASPSWTVYESPEHQQLASWMTPEKVQRLRSMLLASVASRVLDNVWIDSAQECGYLDPLDVTACEELGRVLGLSYQPKGVDGIDYFAGIDYGPKKDRTVLSVLHYQDPEKEGDKPYVAIDRLDVLRGSATEEVPIEAVEAWMEEIAEKFRPHFVVDPYQLLGTIQHYENLYRVDRFEARGGKSNYEMAEAVRSIVTNHRLAWYPGAGDIRTDKGISTLGDEFKKLITKQMSYGYRFDHLSGHHDDRVVSIGMALMHALERMPAPWIPPGNLKGQSGEKVQDFVVRPKGKDRGLWGLC